MSDAIFLLDPAEKLRQPFATLRPEVLRSARWTPQRAHSFSIAVA
jgi:hypothetical protein